MHGFKRIHDRHHVLPDLYLAQGASLTETLGKRLLSDELHHDVAGATHIEVLEDRDDVRMAKSRQDARLFLELTQPFRKLVVVPPNCHDIPTPVPHDPIPREEFLDSHLAAKLQVRSSIGDAKTAAADYLLDAVVPELVARWQRITDVVSHRLS